MKCITTAGLTEIDCFTVWRGYAFAVVTLESEGVKIVRGEYEFAVDCPQALPRFATWREAVQVARENNPDAQDPGIRFYDDFVIRQEVLIRRAEGTGKLTGGLLSMVDKLAAIAGGLDDEQSRSVETLRGFSAGLKDTPLFGIPGHMIE